MTFTTTTTRPVTFAVYQGTLATSLQTLPAGTAVYARPRRGSVELRIPGTLVEARGVHPSAVVAP